MMIHQTLPPAPRSTPGTGFEIAVIAASAGGMAALFELLAELPSSFPLPIVVVLHHSPEFPSMLPSVLGRRTELRVKWAEHGEKPLPGVVYVAPARCQLTIAADRAMALHPGRARFRPHADPLFESAARVFGAGTIGIVLSGVLDDGTRGAAAVRAAGGVAMAQCETSSEFFDMPASARDFGRAELIANPLRMATYLMLMGELPLLDPPASGALA